MYIENSQIWSFAQDPIFFQFQPHRLAFAEKSCSARKKSTTTREIRFVADFSRLQAPTEKEKDTFFLHLIRTLGWKGRKNRVSKKHLHRSISIIYSAVLFSRWRRRQDDEAWMKNGAGVKANPSKIPAAACKWKRERDAALTDWVSARNCEIEKERIGGVTSHRSACHVAREIASAAIFPLYSLSARRARAAFAAWRVIQFIRRAVTHSSSIQRARRTRRAVWPNKKQQLSSRLLFLFPAHFLTSHSHTREYYL